MAKTAEPSVSELETELGQIEARLFPIYVAQEAAQVDLNNAQAAQHSASGAHLTDMVLAARKYKAEVEKFTDQIIPLKNEADALRRKIIERKRTAQLATMRHHAHAAVEHASAIVAATESLATAVAKLVTEHNAVIGAGTPDEQRGLRSEAANFAAVADFVTSKLVAAGLPVRRPMGAGLSPVETTANMVTIVETLK